MKKRNGFLLLGIIASLSLTGCSFFDLINIHPKTIPWDHKKTTPTYLQSDLAERYFFDQTDSTPSVGNPKILVLPIAFSDTSDFLNSVQRQQVKTKLNKAIFGSTSDTGWHSVASFFNEESRGKCNISGMVADWYNCGYSYDAVTKSVDQHTNSSTSNIINAAVANWKVNNPDKISEYDSDNDGFLDGVIAIYGGPDNGQPQSVIGHHTNNSNMWAYTTWISYNSANKSSPNANAFIWASYDFMDADTSHGVSIDAHTYIHEMGHMFGLDDYYDYSLTGYWSGAFSMQDFNVGGHDPYSCMILGWAEPYKPTESATITLNPFTSSGDFIILNNDFENNSPFNEYIILELYTPTGLNAHDSTYQYQSKYPVGSSKAGIRVWHVDSRLAKTSKPYSKSGGTYLADSITTSIESDGYYLVGCSNTTYKGGASSDSYASKVTSLRPYKLLELIRRGDYTASRTSQYLSYDDLFRKGDKFTLSSYSGYFRNYGRFNNGSRFSWTVSIDALSDSSATITVTI